MIQHRTWAIDTKKWLYCDNHWLPCTRPCEQNLCFLNHFMNMGLPLEKEECWLLQVDHHHRHHHHHHNYVHLLREWDLNCERLDLGYFDQKQVPRPLCIHHIVTKTDIIIIITISLLIWEISIKKNSIIKFVVKVFVNLLLIIISLLLLDCFVNRLQAGPTNRDYQLPPQPSM